MVDDIFYIVLNMSITASLIGFLVIMLRFIRQIPRLGIYILWGLVFIRLVFPFAISSEFSLLNFAGGLIKKTVEVPAPLPEVIQERASLYMANSIGAAETYFPITYKSNYLETIFSTASLIWIIVTIVSIIVVIILYCLTAFELRNIKHIGGNIYSGDMVQSPMVHGIFRQRIIIPPSLEKDCPELKYVLIHENIHIRRHDNLFRIIGVLTACLHWFNPLVWVFLKLFFNDMELACDTKAVKLMSKEERSNYARALLDLSTGRGALTTASFGKANVRVRVLNVLNYKRLTVMALMVSILFILGISIVLLTNPIN